MADYSKTISYRIICKDKSITEGYIGHTTNLKKRLNKHKENSLYETKKIILKYTRQ